MKIAIELTEKQWNKVLAVMGEVPAKDTQNALTMIEIAKQGSEAIKQMTDDSAIATAQAEEKPKD